MSLRVPTTPSGNLLDNIASHPDVALGRELSAFCLHQHLDFRVVPSSAELLDARVDATDISAGLVAKARSRPDLVRQVLAKAKADGPLPVLKSVRNRLEEQMPATSA